MARPKKPQKKETSWWEIGLIIVVIIIAFGLLFSTANDLDAERTAHYDSFEQNLTNLCERNQLQFEYGYGAISYCYETQDDMIVKYPIQKIDDKYYIEVQR